MSAPFTVLAEDAAIEKPLLDDRQYKFIKLEKNDLRVLVIHDPATDKAAAALDVNVGSFADKQYTVPGLAHFCEHLLFMGTEKYPAENEYSSYLSENSGHSNAYTASEHTNYFFEVGANHLEGALDRFAQFFISPLFSKSCKDREIRAVDSENKKNLQNDLWRMYQLTKSTSNPNHPYSGFSTGNYTTLNDEPESRGLDVRDVLIQFYKEQYSANLMSLVILGQESLDKLTDWAVQKFSDIPNIFLPRPSYGNEPVIAPEQMGKLLKAKSIMDSNKLELSFPIPNDMEKEWQTKPSQYYSHLLGHESKGSVCFYLKEKNWITSLSAGNVKVCEGSSFFIIDLELTPEGLDHWQDILIHVFEYLKMMHSQDPQEWVWKEVSEMSKIDFRFKQKSGTSSTASKMSSNLYKFSGDFAIPPENLLNYEIISKFDSQKIKQYGDYLEPENFRITLNSQNFENLPLREHWYGSEYSLEDIPDDLFSKLKNVSINKDFNWGMPNKFIPEDFTVLGKKIDVPLACPHLIFDTNKHETWFKQDDTFEVPKGYINLSIHTAVLADSIKTSVLGTLWAEMLDDELNDLKYYASLVGLHCSIYQTRGAITVKVGGYNDKLPEFLEQILVSLVLFKPSAHRFEAIKYKLAQDLKNFGYSTPYSQIGPRFSHLFNDKTYSAEDRLEFIKDVEFAQLEEFSQKNLWSKGVFVQSLIHGNFEYSRACEVHDTIESIFENHLSIDFDKNKVKDALASESVKLAKGENVRYEIDLIDANNINSCIEYYIQVGKLGAASDKLRVLTDLLGVMIHEPCFNQLRTKEQLGYVVFSGYRQTRSNFGFKVLIQSEKPCEYLEYRINEFFKGYKNKSLDSNLSDDAFAKFKEALKIKKLTKLKNLSEEVTRFWNAIVDGFYDFEQMSKDAGILKHITKEDFLNFYNSHFDFANTQAQQPRLSIYLKSQKVPPFEGHKAISAAVFNLIYKHDLDISSELVDKILLENENNVEKSIDEILENSQNISDEFEDLKNSFLKEVKERGQVPTPKEFPHGSLIPLEAEFKKSHEKGGFAVPVKDLTSFYYPHEEAHL